VLTKIAVGIYAGGIVFRALLPEIHFLGMDTFWIGSILLIVLTAIYTIVGGLRAVVYTENVTNICKDHRCYNGYLLWPAGSWRLG
jgi:solute:Na+ symporter, SSS family